VKIPVTRLSIPKLFDSDYIHFRCRYLFYTKSSQSCRCYVSRPHRSVSVTGRDARWGRKFWRGGGESLPRKRKFISGKKRILGGNELRDKIGNMNFRTSMLARLFVHYHYVEEQLFIKTVLCNLVSH
jgi:hypothetical protein